MRKDLVRSLPPVRQAAPPPEALAVEHSSSYLYRQRRQEVCASSVCCAPDCFIWLGKLISQPRASVALIVTDLRTNSFGC